MPLLVPSMVRSPEAVPVIAPAFVFVPAFSVLVPSIVRAPPFAWRVTFVPAFNADVVCTVRLADAVPVIVPFVAVTFELRDRDVALIGGQVHIARRGDRRARVGQRAAAAPVVPFAVRLTFVPAVIDEVLSTSTSCEALPVTDPFVAFTAELVVVTSPSSAVRVTLPVAVIGELESVTAPLPPVVPFAVRLTFVPAVIDEDLHHDILRRAPGHRFRRRLDGRAVQREVPCVGGQGDARGARGGGERRS